MCLALIPHVMTDFCFTAVKRGFFLFEKVQTHHIFVKNELLFHFNRGQSCRGDLAAFKSIWWCRTHPELFKTIFKIFLTCLEVKIFCFEFSLFFQKNVRFWTFFGTWEFFFMRGVCRNFFKMTNIFTYTYPNQSGVIAIDRTDHSGHVFDPYYILEVLEKNFKREISNVRPQKLAKNSVFWCF